jgi:hypothetical protein
MDREDAIDDLIAGLAAATDAANALELAGVVYLLKVATLDATE